MNINDLPRWGDSAPTTFPPSHPLAERVHTTSPFPVNDAVNKKLILWRGDVLTLDVDAVVNSSNESLTDRTGISGRVLTAGGPDLAVECAAVEGCRTGESVTTRGCNLIAKHIIHTVGPRYNEKYRTAAENALHGCYWCVTCSSHHTTIHCSFCNVLSNSQSCKVIALVM